MSDLKTAPVQSSIRAPGSKTAGFLDQTWAWYARHFWTGFCYYLPLPLTLLFLVALVCWRLGESFVTTAAVASGPVIVRLEIPGSPLPDR